MKIAPPITAHWMRLYIIIHPKFSFAHSSNSLICHSFENFSLCHSFENDLSTFFKPKLFFAHLLILNNEEIKIISAPLSKENFHKVQISFVSQRFVHICPSKIFILLVFNFKFWENLNLASSPPNFNLKKTAYVPHLSIQNFCLLIRHNKVQTKIKFYSSIPKCKFFEEEEFIKT